MKIFYKTFLYRRAKLKYEKEWYGHEKETRLVVYDDELQIEVYRFEGIIQPFPNHFHEYYVITQRIIVEMEKK